MRFRALEVYLGPTRAGTLFQFGQGVSAISRFDPDEGLWRNPRAPILSWATVVPEQEREAFWRRSAEAPFFSGRGERLPAFFQNLLPEGMLRDHLAQLRGCAPDDHFEILAACGDDLPGAVVVQPALVDRALIERLVTQGKDSLEPTVVAEPMLQGTSLSGIQPKLSLVESGGRYVARSKDPAGKHVIAKLPTTEVVMLPELEELSLRLATAAGVKTCKATLVPVTSITEDIPFALSESPHFLAVERFDRLGGAHIHCEEFAQIFGILPEEKYQHPSATYSNFAAVLLQMGRPEDVEELLRRLAVNELIGNRDAHAKNLGVIYDDPKTPRLSPAYDIVAHVAYAAGTGHALPFVRGGASAKAGITPRILREFCNAAGVLETKARSIVRQTGEAALDLWPSLIHESVLPEVQRARMLNHLHTNSVASVMIRRRQK